MKPMKNFQLLLTSVFVIASLSLLFTACRKEAQENSPSTQSTLANTSLQNQVANLQWPGIVKSWNSTFPTSNVQPLTFITKGIIANETDKTNIINSMMSDSSYIAQSDFTNQSLPIIKQFYAIKNNELVINDNKKTISASLKAALDSTIRVGLYYGVINWKGERGNFTTLCVYDTTGIVYDNILSNIIVVTDGTKDSTGANSKISAVPDQDQRLTAITTKGKAAAASTKTTSKTFSVVDLAISGVFGWHRGWVKITHTVYYKSGKIITNGCTANASMTLGSAQAKAQNYKCTGTVSQITWAYGWATPTASFNISLNKGSGKLGVSVSGVGSKGSGSGIDTRTN